MVEKLRHPVFLRIFLLRQLPLAFFAGIRLSRLDSQIAVTHVRYRWMTKNPFRSMYFAAQAMAAEFSTGILAALVLERSGENIAMLITANRAEFMQKAKGRVTFTCEDGNKFSEGIQRCINTKEPVQIEALSVGRDDEGTVISEFRFTWSFKTR